MHSGSAWAAFPAAPKIIRYSPLYRARQLNDGGCGSAVVQPPRAASVVAVRTIGGVVVKREREREREREMSRVVTH